MKKLLEFEKKMNNLIGLEFDFVSEGKFCISPDEDEDNKFVTIKFVLTAWKEDDTKSTAEKVTLGHINVLRIPSDMEHSINLGENYNTEEAMKNSSLADLFTVAESLRIGQMVDFPDETQPIDVYGALIYGDLFYITELFVEKEYRNVGLGSALLEALPKLIQYYCGGTDVLIALTIMPIDLEDDEKKAYERLEEFYKRNDFKILENGVCAKRI